MAPIHATATGVTLQRLDDERLLKLLTDLKELPQPCSLENLVKLLRPYQTWVFEEQVDLYEWIDPLNRLDAAIRQALEEYPLLLVPPVKRTKTTLHPKVAESMDDIQQVPREILENLCIVLRFLTSLLQHATSKSLFGSVDELVDLLGCFDANIADAALSVLQTLSLPPALHKQQTPDLSPHTTALHNSVSHHGRLVALARGWGTRAMGLGLYQVVTADDSVHEVLPQEAGQVHFVYYANDQTVQIGLTESEMLAKDEKPSVSNKRRKTNAKKETKSTAELFFLARSKASEIPPDRLFALLADVRLAQSFYAQESRQAAVQRRLMALITILHAHPSQEVMTGYFQAQPELTVELVDLVRPIVANVSSTSTLSSSWHPDAIGNLSSSQTIPYDIRMLALEALTALVSRRDRGALSGSARLSSVLTELGVGKGQYLGLVPTLIRYSLASLSPTLTSSKTEMETSESMDFGLAFCEATMPPLPPRLVQVERALEFIDKVLTLASAVVSTPTGTSALTDCGLVPALLTTVAVDCEKVLQSLLPDASSISAQDWNRVRTLLTFVTAQAVQILEGAIVTHSNALTAFHDLNGVEVLTSRLSREIASDSRIIRSSQRVLMFTIVTCLTVVFHQESSSSSSTTTPPTGGAQLRKPELTRALITIMDDVTSYGGHLASLIATLLSDVMNSDPHVVHYVHKSGIAKSFLNMVRGEKVTVEDGTEFYRPIVPAVPELIMAIPNVLSAMALTEDGAKAVYDENPFPSLLRLFYHPNYAMPVSRCLLNEMTAIVGTGLDEIMRHVDRLKPMVLKAIAEAIDCVVSYAEELTRREEAVFQAPTCPEAQTDVENERTCLMQYILNFGQLLEQILHNEDHCEPFVDAGGLDALLKLFPASLPTGFQFLAHVSGLSSPSVGTLHHSTIEESLSVTFKCIQFRYDSLKLIRKIAEAATMHLDALDESMQTLSAGDTQNVFDRLPREPLHKVQTPESIELSKSLSRYLRNVTNVQWISSILSTAIKAANQRSQERGSGWNREEREWKKELSSTAFEGLIDRLATFHQSSLSEVCRVRTEEDFECRERERLVTRSRKLRFRLRIVCPEGAVVRDGIEIDSCASVGSMEMGEIVDSCDRCINSSGILRYRTQRGWVSEMTRGHGREPIAEVVSMWESDAEEMEIDECDQSKRRVEASVPDLRTVSIGVLARAQTSYSELFSALSRVIVQGVRTLTTRAISFDDGTQGKHVSSTVNLVASNLKKGLARSEIVAATNSSAAFDDPSRPMMSKAGAAMYLGCMLNNLQASLFDDRRERRMINFPLLVNLASSDPLARELSGDKSTSSASDRDGAELGIFGAIQFVFEQGLSDFADRATTMNLSATSSETAGGSASEAPVQRVGRSVAASLPPLISLLRRLSSTPVSSSPVASVMSRIKWKDIPILIGAEKESIIFAMPPEKDDFFQSENFGRCLQVAISQVVKEVWMDPRFIHAPSYLAHPIASLVGDIVVGLEDSTKKKPPGGTQPRSGTLLSEWIRERTLQQEQNEEEEFEPSDETISRLTDMGFSRDHALDAFESTQSNRVEVAMEYALSHPPPSPATVERRRAARAERARRREEQEQQQQADATEAETAGTTGDVTDAAVADSGANNSSASNSDQRELAPEDGPGTQKPSENGKDAITRAKLELASWIEEAPKVCCNVLASMHSPAEDSKAAPEGSSESMGQGDGETEALTVVLCSFMLDLCHRYPENRWKTVAHVLERFKSQIVEQTTDDGVLYQIQAKNEASVASLCHAAVLFTRALPQTRLLVLRKGLVRSLVSCMKSFVGSKMAQDGHSQPTAWPMWLAPALLLIDIMSQPLVAFSDEETLKSVEEFGQGLPGPGELSQVQLEHEIQSKEISALADKITLALSDRKQQKPEMLETGDTQSAVTAEPDSADGDGKTDRDKRGKDEVSPFSSVPAYFPLLPSDTVDDCLCVCKSLLGNRSGSPGRPVPPPGVMQANLMLLLRLLRDPRVSSQCLRTGLAEAILALPSECKFTGNAGLVTLVFRRLLEDDSTLQAAMETEIRSTVTKLLAKQKTSFSRVENPAISLSSFIEAVTPLLCRDPASFLKALALSAKIEPGGSKDSADSQISLLSPEERSKNLASLSELLVAPVGETARGKPDARRRIEPAGRQRRTSSGSKGKSKSPHRNSRRHSSAKKSKKEKAQVQKGGSDVSPSQMSPATHVTCLLINHIMSFASPDSSKDLGELFAEDKAFLWVGSLLEILADLVLAVPACASAVHNYRPRRSRDKAVRTSTSGCLHHALSGCPPPPKTFVTYLLHYLLSQDRWSIGNDPQIWERSKEDAAADADLIKAKKRRAFRVSKVSQNAARVLVALVARPGEGRKRVISDLVFALSGGTLGHGSCAPEAKAELKSTDVDPDELHAIKAWGELCLGLAAPRSSSKNLEGTASLSLDNVRLMLEYGMAHALLYSLHRAKLFHPMASQACGFLLLPFEVLTRASVTDAVRDLINKEAKTKREDEADKAIAEDWKQDDDHDMADAAYHDTAEHELNHGNHGLNDAADFEEDGMNEMEDPDDMEVDDEEEGSEDEETSSGEESDDESSGGESDTDMDDNDDDSAIEESDEYPTEEVEEEGDWNVGYGEAFAGDNPAVNDDFDEAEEDATDRAEQGLDDGWTRIESSGFGGMVLGNLGRRNLPSLNGGDARTRGFVDAAEAMISTLLRTGEISPDALAELEGTLGIRISTNSRTLQDSLGSMAAGAGPGDAPGIRGLGLGGRNSDAEQGRRGEVIGTLPHIHQRSQPDVGYSAFGSGGRWVDVSSMEYVYGGPSVTAGSRNYDLISPVQNGIEMDGYPNFSQLNLQLFPGGPAAAACARSQHSLHPLLCGVDLPPINSLVSDLLPHGVRATRRGQMTTRRPGDWTNTSFSPGGYLVSTSNGNIIRSNRSHSGASLGNGLAARRASGPVGWTDDGLPFDATVEEFSSAFERALSQLVRTTNEGDRTEPATSEEQTQVAETTQNPNDSSTAPENGDANGTERAEEHNDVSGPLVSGVGENQEPAASTSGGIQESPEDNGPGTASVGDGVTSSLASGLRLSPGSDASGNSDQMSAANVEVQGSAPAGQPAPVADATMEEASEPPAAAVDGNDVSTATQGEAVEGHSQGAVGGEEHPADHERNSGENQSQQGEANSNGLVCPPDIDPEVFNSLPLDMQQDCVNEYNATRQLEAQLDGSSLDPEVLAALPEDMRREVIEQDRQERERQSREQQQEAPADPAHAEEMDNASFIASLAPELREEILLTADETFLSSLPPNIVAEAQILRERASAQHRRLYDDIMAGGNAQGEGIAEGAGAGNPHQRISRTADNGAGSSSRRKQRSGKLRVESDRQQLVYLPDSLSDPISKADLKALIRLMYLLTPVRPSRLLQKIFQNLCINPSLRSVLSTAFVRLLHEDGEGALAAIEAFGEEYDDEWRKSMDEMYSDKSQFPPKNLIGAAPEIPETESFNLSISASLLRRKQGLGTAASMAANLPKSTGGSRTSSSLPPVVAARIMDTILQLCKNSPRFSLHSIAAPLLHDTSEEVKNTCFEALLDLLDKPAYAKSSANLDQLLTLLEAVVSPLSHLSKHGEEDLDISQREIDAAAAAGKEWVDVPRVAVSQNRLQLLCSILRMETCRESAFTKVNTIVRRLCRVEANRGYVLAELGTVAHALGADAIRDLRALRIRLDDAVAQHKDHLAGETTTVSDDAIQAPSPSIGTKGAISSSVALSTSTSEIKLLRVLQTLQALCVDAPEDSSSKKSEGSIFVTEELVHLLRQMQFDDLWDELTSCLKVVHVLEGVATVDEEEEKGSDDMETNDDASGDDNSGKGKKLRNSVAGLLTRFLPSIEAFFVANASATRPKEKTEEDESPAVGSGDISLDSIVGGSRLMDFVATNRVLLNALIRNNPGLLDRGLRGLVQVPRCRGFLDFDVKRQWFKTQMRRLRQHASRRHGSLRLHIRRKYVFEDAYHQLRLRNAEEMRGRLHITFRNEQGVDAGGLSREFFAILAKEIFNPNYALFTSTEDGCTFQPNPNSSINPDHLSYFRFVGRIVGKAVADGYLLDAHFTRSLYKHMLGMKPTHHDMEAIDPDYYKNLKTILEYNLDDIGLDLTFSIEDHSFGRSQVIDLVPNGRKMAVTEENKEKYVRLVCQHRMTTAIQSQIKAYLDGVYELVSPELIAIFTPRELELLISGLPDIDVLDLKKNTEYVVWKATDKEIGWFWNIMMSLSRNEKAAFLQFVTGSSKVPLAGFSELQGMRGIQKFSIHKVSGTKGALMSAHTCFNSLDLPAYQSEEEMREKLLYAINEGGGAFMFA